MNTTDANPAAPKWVLFLFPGNRLGQICCTFPGASPIKEFVPGRWARMLLMLQRAYIEDKDLPADVRGYRAANELAKAYEENPRVDPPLATTMTSYVYRLCNVLKTRTSDSKAFPPLIERSGYRGVRLLYPLEIRYVGVPLEIDV